MYRPAVPRCCSRAGRLCARRRLPSADGVPRRRHPARDGDRARGAVDCTPRAHLDLHRPVPHAGAQSGCRPSRKAAEATSRGDRDRLHRGNRRRGRDRVSLHPDTREPGQRLRRESAGLSPRPDQAGSASSRRSTIWSTRPERRCERAAPRSCSASRVPRSRWQKVLSTQCSRRSRSPS
jgi:hypothetical protein